MSNVRERSLALTPETFAYLTKLATIITSIDLPKVRAVGRYTQNTPGALQVLNQALRNPPQMGNLKASLKADCVHGCVTIEIGFDGYIAHVWARTGNGDLFGVGGSVLQIDHRRVPVRMTPDAQAALQCIERVLTDSRVHLRGVGLDANGEIIRLPEPWNSRSWTEGHSGTTGIIKDRTDRTVTPFETDRLLPLDEAAALALVSIPTLKKWAAEGMPVVTTDRLLVSVNDLRDRLGRFVTPTTPAFVIIPAGIQKNELPDD